MSWAVSVGASATEKVAGAIDAGTRPQDPEAAGVERAEGQSRKRPQSAAPAVLRVVEGPASCWRKSVSLDVVVKLQVRAWG